VTVGLASGEQLPAGRPTRAEYRRWPHDQGWTSHRSVRENVLAIG